jgi:hypothetical protein
MRFVISLLVILILLSGGGWLCTKNYEDTFCVRDQFYLDQDFDTVRKIFVRTKASDEVIKLQYAEILEKKTTGFNFRLRPLQISLSGWLKVQSKYEDTVMDLNQQIQITNDSLWSSYRLILPTPHKKAMQHQVLMVREGNRTRVDVAQKITVRYTIPFFYEKKAKQRVETGINEWMQNLQTALKEVVERYAHLYADY